MQNNINKTEKTEKQGSGEFSIRSAYERASRRSDGFDPSVSFGEGASIRNEPVKTAGDKNFTVGDTVHHKIFGTGTVVAVTPVAGDMLVEVKFTSATKKMMANYAPLTKK